MREAFQIVLLEIEAGNLSWADVGPINLILKQAIIDIVARPTEDKDNKSRQTGKGDGTGQATQKRKPRTCAKYQKGLCTENQNHYLGRWLYHHACSLCLKATSELIIPLSTAPVRPLPQPAQLQKTREGPPAVSRGGHH